METVEGWAFLLGPMAGVVLVPIAWAFLNNAARPMPFRRAITPSALLIGGLIAAHWVVWRLWLPRPPLAGLSGRSSWRAHAGSRR